MVRSVLLVAAAVWLAACAPNGAGQGVGAIGADAAEPDAAGTEVDAGVAVEVDDVPRVRRSRGEPIAPTVRESDEPADDVDRLVDPGVGRPLTVAVVGDSLTLSAEDEIVRALNAAGMHVLAIDGVESRRMTHGGPSLPPGTDAIDRIRAEHDPGVWVIALGTNDVASIGSAAGFSGEMRDVLALIPDDDPVIWVDLWIGGRETPVSDANEVIRTELRRWQGGAAVVDWFSHGTDEGVITGDGVHLTQSGQELYASSIVSAIDELFAP